MVALNINVRLEILRLLLLVHHPICIYLVLKVLRAHFWCWVHAHPVRARYRLGYSSSSELRWLRKILRPTRVMLRFSKRWFIILGNVHVRYKLDGLLRSCLSPWILLRFIILLCLWRVLVILIEVQLVLKRLMALSLYNRDGVVDSGNLLNWILIHPNRDVVLLNFRQVAVHNRWIVVLVKLTSVVRGTLEKVLVIH